MNNTDWLPGTLKGQLAIVQNWLDVLAYCGGGWSVLTSETIALEDLYVNAVDAFKAAVAGGRSETTDARCCEAFAALAAKMRWFKEMHFTQPPLLNSDMRMLGIN